MGEIREKLRKIAALMRQGIEVYRMPNGRNLCAECLAKHRLAGLKKLDEAWSRKGLVKLFRVICSDDLSEFKFLSEKGGWENPIRFPGNARREDTEAGKFYRELYGRGGHEG